MIDLKELEQSLDDERIIELVMELGSDEYKDTPNAIIFKTICHNIDPAEASLKLYYYKNNKQFHCFTECSENFNIFELFKKRYKLLGIKYNFYQDIVLKIAGNNYQEKGLEFVQKYETEFDRYKRQKIEVNIPKISPALLNIYEFYPTIEWLSDGISEQTMREYQIRYSSLENKIIIPHYDSNGYLIGIRGRSLNEDDIEVGKYMPVQIEGKLYSHPLGYNLYGLNFIKGNIKKFKTAIITEGEKGVLQLNTILGHDKNIAVAACGSSFHKYQLELLLAAGAERVILAFDKEGEDWKKKEKYYSKLKTICSRYKNICNMGFIYDFQNLLSLKESPTDKGKETFMKLYNNTIWL
jgi:hypothetical protein